MCNLERALKRVESNRGSPGVDGMKVQDLRGHLVDHWPAIREQLLNGAYRPMPVKRVDIPKPGGGMRQLGVPTVLDRSRRCCRSCRCAGTAHSRSIAMDSGRGVLHIRLWLRRNDT